MVMIQIKLQVSGLRGITFFNGAKEPPSSVQVPNSSYQTCYHVKRISGTIDSADDVVSIST